MHMVKMQTVFLLNLNTRFDFASLNNNQYWYFKPLNCYLIEAIKQRNTALSQAFNCPIPIFTKPAYFRSK